MVEKNSNNSNDKKKTIDQIDAKMINLLQEDGRLPNTDIAKRLGISEATVRGRLRRLIEEGFIQIVAVSNPFKLGFEMAGDLYIHVDMKKIEYVISELKKIKELWYIVVTTGNTYINAEFVVKTREELNELVFDKITKIDGVNRIDTSIIMKFEKRKYSWGTAID
jgi:Lrp/AsnC family transcriptional regulator, regulator for asnA, asnC and gidA